MSRGFRRKGGLALGSIPADLFAFVVFVIVLLVFFGLFFYQGCSNENINIANSQRYGDILDSNIILLNYLRTPVTVNNIGLVMADSADFNLNPMYKEIILNRGKEIRREGDDYIWCRESCEGQRGMYSDSELFERIVDAYYLPTINFSVVEVEMYRSR